MYWQYLLVFLGAGIGGVLRYFISLQLAIPIADKAAFPWSTFLINCIGCLAIGCFAGLLLKYNTSDNWKVFLTAGLCGGFTTFSAFGWEALQLSKTNIPLALAYVLASCLMGVMLCGTGFWLTK